MENKIYKNTYFQGTLTEQECKELLHIRGLSEIPELKNSIYFLNNQQIQRIQELVKEEKKKGTLHNNELLKQIQSKQGLNIGELTAVQTQAVGFMLVAKRCLLGDSVGLGKTVQTAALCNILEALYAQKGEVFRFCYLAEKNSVLELQQKLIQFTGSYVGVLKSAENQIVQEFLHSNTCEGQTKADYNIIGTHALINNPDFLVYNARHPFDLIVIDESAFLKNKDNETYKNTKALLKNTPYRVLLNATPVETSIEDLYSQMALLDEGYMPTLTEFRRTYCKKDLQYRTIGIKNEDIFKKAIELRYIARKRNEHQAKFEGNTSKRYVIEYSPDQKRIKSRTSMFQMVYDYPSGVDLMLQPTEQNTPKVACVKHILKTEIPLGEKVLIYCHYKDAQTYLTGVLKAEGYKVGCTSDLTVTKRKKIIKDFTDGDLQILVTNLKKGIDINSCNYCIMYTVDTNPANLLQVEGRMTREFNICNKNIYLLVMQGDEVKRVNTLLKNRVKIAENLVSTDYSMVLDNIMKENNAVYFTAN